MKKDPFVIVLLKIAAVIFVSLSTIVLFFVGVSVVVGLLVGIFVAAGDLDTSFTNYKTLYGKEGSGKKLISISVTGVILGEREDTTSPLDLLGGGVVYGYEVKQQLMDAADDKSIQGIVLEINSPGGTIYGAHAIADGVTYYRAKTKKPVIAYIGGLGASGGYWVASSTDSIFADYGSTIGSIGVIFGPIKYYDTVTSEDGGAFVGGVVTQNGIDTTYFTAGKSKDVGNPYRQLTQEEIVTLQRSVNNEYGAFVSFVSARRKIPQQTLRSQIGAMVYENESAKSLHLIDGTKNKQDAYADLAQRAGLKENAYEVVSSVREPALVELLLESMAGKQKTSVSSCLSLSSVVLAYHGDLAALCQ